MKVHKLNGMAAHARLLFTVVAFFIHLLSNIAPQTVTCILPFIFYFHLNAFTRDDTLKNHVSIRRFLDRLAGIPHFRLLIFISSHFESKNYDYKNTSRN